MTAHPRSEQLKRQDEGDHLARSGNHHEAPPLWREGFSRDQLRKLASEINPRHIHSREFDGRRLSYIEGWYAIAEANAIFGYAGWDREMVHFERVIEKSRSDATVTCGYMARVRIRVRAGSTEIVREGTGWGSASASTAPSAHERALKAAETDATKRALSTFGSRFGLNLYDKDHVSANQRPTFTLFAPDGRALADNLSAEGYSSGLRQLIEICIDTCQVDQLSRHNRASLSDLRVYVPSLRNAQGVHFADLLLRLMRRRRERVGAGTSSSENSGARLVNSDGNGAAEGASTGASILDRAQPNGRSHDRTGDVTVFGLGAAFRRYTGQSPRRRTPYPIPSRTALVPEGPSAEEKATLAARNEVTRPASPDHSEGIKVNPQAVDPATEAKVGVMIATPIAAGMETSPPQAADPAITAESKSTPTLGDTPIVSAIPDAADDYRKVASVPTLSKKRANGSDDGVVSPTPPSGETPSVQIASPPSKIASGLRIDKSKLWLGLERRIRDKNHLRQVAELPCLVCNRQPSHAHHLRFAQRRGLSQKVSDEYVVPLCALHHGDLHRSSSEQQWWERQRIDPLPVSAKLWTNNHKLEVCQIASKGDPGFACKSDPRL